MTTTIGISDRDNERLEALIDQHDLGSKKGAFTYMLDQLERASDRESLQNDLARMPPLRDTHYQIFESHGHEHALTVPDDLAQYLLESGDAHRMFTLFERYCPYLYLEHGVAGTMVESVYRLNGAGLTYLFVYHPLNQPAKPRATFVVEGEWVEDEIVNILQATEWAAPPGGVPQTYEFDEFPEPTFGGVSRHPTEEERAMLYDLPTVEQIIDDFARQSREQEAQEEKQADEEGRPKVSAMVDVDDPDDLIRKVEEAYDETFGLDS